MTPSTTMSGSDAPITVLMPRIWICAPLPGAPELVWMFAPAILPWSALSTEVAGTVVTSSPVTSDVDVVAKSLLKHGFNAAPLHGDLDQSLRTKTLDSFRSGELKILIASDVAARGLDIPAVSHIFNFDVPFHPDDYVHRIGRTGRAGRIGHALMLATPRDERQVSAIEHLIKTTIPHQTMENLEVREDRKPRREHEHARGARQRKDKFRPDKFHDHIAPMEPAAPVAASSEKVAAEPVSNAAPARPARKHEPRREQHRPPQKKRDPEHRAGFDRKNDATPVKPEKHQLPAFLFRPVRLSKKADVES